MNGQDSRTSDTPIGVCPCPSQHVGRTNPDNVPECPDVTRIEGRENVNQQVSRSSGGRWKPGQSGNPAGRAIGARQRLSEQMLSDLADVWKVSGKDVLEGLVKDDPGKLATIAYGLLPRDVFVSVTQSGPGDVTPDQWMLLRSILDVIERSIPPGVEVVPSDVLHAVEHAVRAHVATPVE